MVGTLVKLQLKLFTRSVRGNVGKLIALLLGGLYLGGLVLGAIFGEIALRSASLPIAGGVLTLGLSMVTLSWPFITLLVAGIDQTLDPGRFALFPVKARALLPGLLIAGSLTLGGVATALVALGTVATWSAWPIALPAAVVGLVLGLATCLLISRALASVFSSAITQRKYRDRAAIALGLIGLSVGVGAQFISRFVTEAGVDLGAQVVRIGQILGWTPFGWAWSLPWEAAQGRWLVVLAKLVLAVGLAAGAWWLWERNLDKALVSPLETGGDGTKVKSNGLVERLVPTGPVGAVAARTLRYWRRDPRHLILLVSVLLLPVLMVAPVLINPETLVVNGETGAPGGMLLFAPVASILLMTALTVAGEINMDGSALWMQVSSGVRGYDDRLGRLIGLGWVLVPLAVLTMLAFVFYTKRWDLTVPMISAGIGSLLGGAAVGSLAGAVWQWPTPPPGQNAFAKSSGGGAMALISTLVCLIGSLVVCSPVLAVALLAAGRPVFGWLAAGLAFVVYPVVLWLGLKVSGRLLDRTWPEVLKRVSAPVS